MRHRITMTILGITATAATLMTACSSSAQPGSPRSAGDATGSASSAPSSSTSGGAPHVAKPLDTSKFEAAPCTVLSQQDAQSLGFANPGAPQQSAFGPGCDWKNSDHSVDLDVTFMTSNKNGLGTLYGKRNSLELFQPLPNIQGYPAVAYGPIDSRKSGTCNVDVGVSDTLNFDVIVQASDGPAKADPCGYAQQVAAMVMKNATNPS